MARGIERCTIFLEKSYNFHFLDLLGEMSSRYSVEVHAYVLLGNHYHLILRTPEANASAAMQWLNVSYSAWFNAKQQRVGHVFQGRFRSALVDGDGSWLLDLSAYIHLNPVRVSALGLDKNSNRAEAQGLVAPDKQQVAERLKVLRQHQWSSYRSYGNYSKTPEWLVTDEILRRAGSRAAYRKLVQQYVTRGLRPEEFGSFTERIAIGHRDFLQRARKLVGSASPEQSVRSLTRRTVEFASIVHAVEAAKGEKWDAFRRRYGDWGCAMVLHLARQRTGLTLREIGERAGGLSYKAVSAQIARLRKQLPSQPSLRRIERACLREL